MRHRRLLQPVRTGIGLVSLYLFVLASLPLPALSQSWPVKPIRLIATQGAGSATDTVGRYYADKLARALGQTIVVENRPGGANLLGMEAAARAPADGYNFLLGTSASFTTNVYLFKSLPYDPIKDFVPVAMLTKPGFTVAVHAKLPPKSLAELAALS